MTMHTFGGFRITTNLSGAPTGFQSSSMRWTTSEFFRFQYTMDTPTAGAFSSITMDLPGGSTLVSAVINSTLRVNLDAVASVGRWTWGGGNQTTVLAIQTASNQTHYYAMAGAALPTFASLTDFTNFMATVTATTSIISPAASLFGPRGATQTLIDMSKTRAFVSSTQDDVIVGIDGIDDWSVTPLILGLGNDSFSGTSGADIVEGGVGNDTLTGNAGADTLAGQDGDDQLFGGSGNDSLEGGDGNDLIYGGTDNDVLNGSTGNDTLFGGNGGDRLIGGEGNDLLHGDDGRDTIDGGNGTDTIFGGSGNDTLLGAGGADLIYGGADDDSISGGSQNDTLFGGDGADKLDGGGDNDLLEGDAGNDTLLGGSGFDTLSGGDGDDRLNGGADNDFLYGGADNDSLLGDAGNDVLYGGLGNDTIRGGLGNDSILGGAGDDLLNGGAGADSFYFAMGGGADTVADFRFSDGDRLMFTSALNLDAAALFAAATQSGANVVFDLGTEGSVTVRNTTLSAVEDAIFVWDELLGL